MVEHQIPLFAESPEEALRAVIAHLGGAKTVGAKLRPDLPADDAGRWLIKCLDHDRAEKLSLTQILWLLRSGHDAGAHTAMQYLAWHAGYQAVPVEPADEHAALQRAFIESVAQQRAMLARMERLAGASPVGAAPSLRPVA